MRIQFTLLCFLLVGVGSCTISESVETRSSDEVVVHKSAVWNGLLVTLTGVYPSLEYGEGKDGEYFTDDDEVVSLVVQLGGEYVVAYGGDQDALLRLSGIVLPGPDGKYFTPDDGVKDLIADVSFEAGGDYYYAALELDYPYLEGLDEKASVFIYTRESRSQDLECELTTYVHGTGPGVDGMWFSSDDVYQEQYSVSHVCDNSLTRTKTYSSGADLLILTGDDELKYEAFQHSVAIPNSMGMHQQTTWGVGSASAHRSYIDSNNVSFDRVEVFPGDDGEFLTEDDVVTEVREFEVLKDEDGMRIRFIRKGLSFSGEHVVVEYREERHIETQTMKLVTTRYYDGPGEDGDWFTGDDQFVTKDQKNGVWSLDGENTPYVFHELWIKE